MTNVTTASPALLPLMALREFLDEDGRHWRAWDVYPSRVPVRRQSKHAPLGTYADGWLAFECESAGERRRLPRFPAGWSALSDRELCRLCAAADPVSARRRRTG